MGIKGRGIRGLPALGVATLMALGPATLGASAIGGPASSAQAYSAQPLSVSVGTTPISPAIRPGFVGLSIEFWALRSYTGGNPRAINRVLVQLIRNLAPRQAPVLRIGGDSTDATWWPTSGVKPPPAVNYGLTDGWMRTTRALAAALGARLILGVNLEANDPKIASEEAGQFLRRIGRRQIEALEIGNEPDLYNAYPWYALPGGQIVFGRSPSYGLQSLIGQFSRWRAVLPTLPIAGPALATLPWMNDLGQFLSAEARVRLATVHRYPLSSCEGNRGAADYPTIGHLLSAEATTALAAPVARYVGVANAHGAQLRVDEMNSVSCRGRRGVSNTFASALWGLDTLFEFARAGVVGVNVHTLPGAAYELFTFGNRRHHFTAFVHPEYYGLQLFARAAPPGSRLVSVTGGTGAVKAWATRGPHGTVRVVLINLDRRAGRLVYVRVPRSGGFARVELLRAHGVGSTGGVTLAGQTYGDRTDTGRLKGAPRIARLLPLGYGNVYAVGVPAASAAMLTR